MLVYTMKDTGTQYDLEWLRTLRGMTRDRAPGKAYFTKMLGLGIAPPVEELYRTLNSGTWRNQSLEQLAGHRLVSELGRR